MTAYLSTYRVDCWHYGDDFASSWSIYVSSGYSFGDFGNVIGGVAPGNTHLYHKINHYIVLQ